MPPILDIEAVSYEAGGKRIIDSATWRVERGEHWAVLGPNGAGKTTLLRLACGYLWPNAGGVVRREGSELADLRELRRSIGWVTTSLTSQIPRRERVHDTVVSGKFAQTGLMPMDWDPATAADYEHASQLLRELACEHLADRPFGVLSQGEQQRVLIARARMARPLLVVLDEPCAGLDPGAREQFLALLQEMATRPEAPSLVFVTHRIEELVPAVGKLLALRDGRVVCCGELRNVVNADLFRTLYDVPVAELIERHGRYWPIW